MNVMQFLRRWRRVRWFRKYWEMNKESAEFWADRTDW